MSTKLLRQIQAQDQEELAARYNGETRRRRSEWVIDRLRTQLPPDHIALANRLMDLQATAEGIATMRGETIDGGGNGREIAMHHRCDAQQALNGFDAAIRSRLGSNGSRCLWAIVWGHSLAETITACSYATGSHGMVKRLVQLTMLAAQEYDDANAAQRQLHKEHSLCA